MKRILPFVFVLGITSVWGQTVLENNPSGLKWYQVNTPNFRILFPKGFELQAQRMANTLEHIHDVEARSLGTKPKKISIILQNQSATSNGFVSMLPRRSEFYTMAPQDYNFLGTNDWLDLLAAHEYRHIVQYQHATRGFNKFLYYAFGNMALAGMAQVSAPSWFWEGDAVATETAFTHSGRGRIPNFDLVFKTNLMEGRTFDYHKQYLRSYKHNIPDHYVLGYNMVSYLRRKTNDPEIWGKITARSWDVPFIPFAFSRSIRKEAGMNVTELYDDMATTLQQEWKDEIDQLQLTTFEKVNPRNTSAYTDYLYPQPMPDGSVLALKQGIGDIQKFVSLKDGEEQRIFTPGFINDSGMLSAGYTAVLWNEYGYDPRWAVRNYSLIKLYDYKTKQKRVIGGKHNRYGSAALSPAGDKIVTVRSDNDYQNTVVVLEIFSGKVIQEFPNPENYFYAMPRWSDDGKKIVVLKTTPEGKTISSLDPETRDTKDLLPITQENVGHPVSVGRYIFFNSPVSGIDNIYALDTLTGTRYQVTSSKYGAYNPGISVDQKLIYYNEQAKDGMDVVKIPFDVSAWKVFEVKKQPRTFFQHLVEQEGRPNLFDSIPQQQLPITKYSKLKGMLNPYAWGIMVNTDNLMRMDIGITSRDILSTTNITAGYTYDLNENTGFWKAGISFQGWYPILDLDFTKGNRTVNVGPYDFYDRSTNPVSVVTKDVIFNWTEMNLEGGLRIPLNTTHSKYSSNLTLGNSVGLTEVTEFTNSIDGGGRIIPVTDSSGYFFLQYQDNGTLLYNHASAMGYRLLKKSRRDINSRWGQVFYLDFYNTPYGGDFSGGNFSFYGIGYFPGFFKHHSLWGYWAYQRSTIDPTDATNYIFRNKIPLPRGQDPARFQDFYSMAGNYTLPLWYPDFTAGPWLNVQRIRANVFFDYGFGSSTFPEGGRSQAYTSTGVEVKFDINIMRFLPQFDIGFRYSYGISPETTQFEVLIGTFRF